MTGTIEPVKLDDDENKQMEPDPLSRTPVLR